MSNRVQFRDSMLSSLFLYVEMICLKFFIHSVIWDRPGVIRLHILITLFTAGSTPEGWIAVARAIHFKEERVF